MRLLNLYKAILESLGVYADELGLLTRRQLDGQAEPVNVSVDSRAKRLILPHPELLRKGIPDELVTFHPMSEVSNRGESEVFRKLKLLVNLRLTTALVAIMEDLAELAADRERHATLSPKLLPMLEIVSNADQKFVSNLHSVINAALAGGKNRLLSIYMNRGGKYMGERRARVAIVAFPILEELLNEDRKVFGVQLRAKDVTQLKDLFEWILPKCSEVGSYNAYSDSLDAPYFEALMNAYVKVAKPLNAAIKIAGKHIENGSSLRIDTSWSDEIRELETMRHEIPPLEGNKGISLSGRGDEPTPAADGLQSLSSRVSVPEPAVQSTIPVQVHSVAPVQVVDAPKSSFNTDITSNDLRAQLSKRLIDPMSSGNHIVSAQPTGPVMSSAGPGHGGSRLSDVMKHTAPSVAPPPMHHVGPMSMPVQMAPNGYHQPVQYAQPVGHYPQNGYHQPVQMMPNGHYQPSPQPSVNIFAQIDRYGQQQMMNRPAGNNWGNSWQ